MKVERIIRSIQKSLEQVIIALDNRLTAQDNLAPTRLTGTRVLTSLGPNKVPTWELTGSDGNGGEGTPGIPGIQGPKGDPGPPGQDADPADVVAQFDRIVTADFGNLGGLEVMVDGDGNVMWI